MSQGSRYCGSCGSAIAPTNSTQFPAQDGANKPDMIGREVSGRYRILAKLGEGGMGAVYRAEQISLKRIVALKVLKPELSAEPGLVRRFNAEATLAAKLNHPNTVTLFDFGQDDDGSLYIAMEYIEGKSLRQILVKHGPLPLERVLAITEQICGSLSDAHATGIVHRDLKPDNVMLFERGKQTEAVSVLDFGIAKLRDEHGNITQQPMTQAGDILGTPQYMAPEQIRGDQVDARTDVYALGVMLYEMVTARLPFEGATVMALLSKHLTDTPVAPTVRRPELAIPQPISDLIMRCLAKSPADRPRTMDHVEELLSSIRPTSPMSGSAAPPSNFRPEGPAPQSVAALAEAPTGYASASGATPGAQGPTRVPPGSGFSHPAPAPIAGAPHASSPAPAPLPTARLPGPRKSRAGLWISLALVLLGAGGAGAYALLATQESEPNEGDFDMSAWESDEPSSASDGDERTDEHEPSTLGAIDGEDVVTEIYTDPAFNYRMSLPANFQGESDRMGASLFEGTVGGHSVRILTSAWVARTSSETDMENEIKARLKTFEVNVESLRWRDAQTLVGNVVAPGDGLRGEMIVHVRGSTLFLAAIGSPDRSLEATRKFRHSFLRDDFEAF